MERSTYKTRILARLEVWKTEDDIIVVGLITKKRKYADKIAEDDVLAVAQLLIDIHENFHLSSYDVLYGDECPFMDRRLQTVSSLIKTLNENPSAR